MLTRPLAEGTWTFDRALEPRLSLQPKKRERESARARHTRPSPARSAPSTPPPPPLTAVLHCYPIPWVVHGHADTGQHERPRERPPLLRHDFDLENTSPPSPPRPPRVCFAEKRFFTPPSPAETHKIILSRHAFISPNSTPLNLNLPSKERSEQKTPPSVRLEGAPTAKKERHRPPGSSPPRPPARLFVPSAHSAHSSTCTLEHLIPRVTESLAVCVAFWPRAFGNRGPPRRRAISAVGGGGRRQGGRGHVATLARTPSSSQLALTSHAARLSSATARTTQLEPSLARADPSSAHARKKKQRDARHFPSRDRARPPTTARVCVPASQPALVATERG